MTIEEAVAELVRILRPFRNPDVESFEGDRVAQDDDIRNIVRRAIKELDLDGLGGCRLCLS